MASRRAALPGGPLLAARNVAAALHVSHAMLRATIASVRRRIQPLARRIASQYGVIARRVRQLGQYTNVSVRKRQPPGPSGTASKRRTSFARSVRSRRRNACVRDRNKAEVRSPEPADEAKRNGVALPAERRERIEPEWLAWPLRLARYAETPRDISGPFAQPQQTVDDGIRSHVELRERFDGPLGRRGNEAGSVALVEAERWKEGGGGVGEHGERRLARRLECVSMAAMMPVPAHAGSLRAVATHADNPARIAPSRPLSAAPAELC